jgi:transcriptional regulator of NAD metabolism
VYGKGENVMDGEERKQKILTILSDSKAAVTGASLSRQCDVSRQIIVGDIALLRAQGHSIISTPRGYQIVHEVNGGLKEVVVCCHGVELMKDELEAIVDNGGIVHNVCIEHEVYGYMEASLKLRSRRDIAQYIDKMKKSKAQLLSKISGGIHSHLIETVNMEDMEAIKRRLDELGILYKN